MKRTVLRRLGLICLLGVSGCGRREMKRSGLLPASRYNAARVLIAGLILALELGLGSEPAPAQNTPSSPVSGSLTFTAINFPGGTRTRAVGLKLDAAL